MVAAEEQRVVGFEVILVMSWGFNEKRAESYHHLCEKHRKEQIGIRAILYFIFRSSSLLKIK
jgi:hypothetical protein